MARTEGVPSRHETVSFQKHAQPLNSGAQASLAPDGLENMESGAEIIPWLQPRRKTNQNQAVSQRREYGESQVQALSAALRCSLNAAHAHDVNRVRKYGDQNVTI